MLLEEYNTLYASTPAQGISELLEGTKVPQSPRQIQALLDTFTDKFGFRILMSLGSRRLDYNIRLPRKKLWEFEEMPWEPGEDSFRTEPLRKHDLIVVLSDNWASPVPRMEHWQMELVNFGSTDVVRYWIDSYDIERQNAAR